MPPSACSMTIPPGAVACVAHQARCRLMKATLWTLPPSSQLFAGRDGRAPCCRRPTLGISSSSSFSLPRTRPPCPLHPCKKCVQVYPKKSQNQKNKSYCPGDPSRRDFFHAVPVEVAGCQSAWLRTATVAGPMIITRQRKKSVDAMRA